MNLSTLNSDARTELESIRADVRARGAQALRREIGRYAGELLPGAVGQMTEQWIDLAAFQQPGRLAREVFVRLQGPLGDRFKKPECLPGRGDENAGPSITLDGRMVHPETPRSGRRPGPRPDYLKATIARYADILKPGEAEKLYNRLALDLSHRAPAEIVEQVVLRLHDHKFNAFLRTPNPLPAGQVRVLAALAPWKHQLKPGAAETLAVEMTDLYDVIEDRTLAVFVQTRLGLPGNAEHLRGGAGSFDPLDRDRSGDPAPSWT